MPSTLQMVKIWSWGPLELSNFEVNILFRIFFAAIGCLLCAINNWSKRVMQREATNQNEATNQEQGQIQSAGLHTISRA